MILFMCGCAQIEGSADISDRRVRIVVGCPGYSTKAVIPDEDRVNDINILIFENGLMEEAIWREGIYGQEDLEFEITLVKGREYSVCVVANMGTQIKPESMKDLENMAFARNIPTDSYYDEYVAAMHRIYSERPKASLTAEDIAERNAKAEEILRGLLNK